MYFSFLQNDFNPYYYYYLNAAEAEPQSPERLVQCLIEPISPTEPLKIEEIDAEDMESFTLDNISINAKDLREAGYEKKKQPWTEEEDRKLLALVAKKLRWMHIA